MATAPKTDKNLPATTGDVSKLPAHMSDDALAMMAAAGGAGFEDVKASDLALPFVKLLQSLSPETRKTEPAYVKGAEEGLYFDTISRRMFRNIVVVPVKCVVHYIEWRPRSAGGGFVKNHGADAGVLTRCHRDEKTGRDVTPDGNEIVPTSTWFCLLTEGTEILPDGSEAEVALMQRCVLSFAGTAFKVGRRWMSDAQALRVAGPGGKLIMPPLFAMSYRLGSAATKNDQGSWMLPTVARDGFVFEKGAPADVAPLWKEAQEYHSFANEYHAAVAIGERGDEPVDVTSRAREVPAHQQEMVDDNIPF